MVFPRAKASFSALLLAALSLCSALPLEQTSFLSLSDTASMGALLAPSAPKRLRKSAGDFNSKAATDKLDVVSGLPLDLEQTGQIELLKQPRRVVAVGDLHGDLTQAKAVLSLMGLTNAAGQWTGNDSVLVQTGDLCDRGAETKQLIEYFEQLRTQAGAAGGACINLLGNHELMNMEGDWAYVSEQDLEVYGGMEPRKQQFSKIGANGQWLRNLTPTVRVGDSVFVHGGITADFAKHGVTGINAAAREALQADNFEDSLFGNDGPLWYRGFAQDDDDDIVCPNLERSLKALGAERMVVGHTRQEDGTIKSRCDSRLIMIDVGVSGVYDGGHTAALEIAYEAGQPMAKTTAVYPEERDEFPPPKECKFSQRCHPTAQVDNK